jgi:RNA polymerase sigma factor (sigma-70 family)
MPADSTDRELVEALLRGDEPAVRTLVARYDRLVRFTIFRVGRRYCQRDPGWLDARANEAWAGIVQSLRRGGQQRIPLDLPAYFVQISKNKCLDAVRVADARRVIPIDVTPEAAEGLEAPISADHDPASVLENLEQIDALRECIMSLNPDDRTICGEIELILDKRWKEAADRLGLPESTLRSRWTGVLDRLRRCVEKKIRKKFAPGADSADT